MQCLILDNPEVKAAVDELTTVLGSEDAAYYIISENNGYAIDQAPNGEPSKLFSDLLSHYNGNREQAIEAKSKVFSDGFKASNLSTQLDENQEPNIEQVLSYDDSTTFSYEYHPAEEFATFFVTNTGQGSATSSELVERIIPYVSQDSPARRLLNLFKNTDIPVTFVKLGLEGKYMFYDAKNHTITINTDKFGINSMEFNAESILHEIVHAYTTRTLLRVKSGSYTAQEKKIYDKLVQLQKEYSELFKDKKDDEGKFHDEFYGLNDIDEFAAELLTNRDFFNLIQRRTEDINNLSFFNKIKEFVKLLLEYLGWRESDAKQMYDDLVDLVSFNIRNHITEQEFIDTNSDLIFREESAVRMMEQILNSDEIAKNEFDKITHNLAQTINESLTSRLKTFKHSDPIVEQQMKKTMEWQIQNITQGLVSDYENINNFLQQSADEIKSASEMLIKTRKNNEIIDNDKLNDLDQNFLVFMSVLQMIQYSS